MKATASTNCFSLLVKSKQFFPRLPSLSRIPDSSASRCERVPVFAHCGMIFGPPPSFSVPALFPPWVSRQHPSSVLMHSLSPFLPIMNGYSLWRAFARFMFCDTPILLMSGFSPGLILLPGTILPSRSMYSSQGRLRPSW